MKTRVFVQQVHGAPYTGAERSIASLLEAGLEAKLAWLARFGLEVSFGGELVEGEAGPGLPGRVEAAASRLEWEGCRSLFLASDHSATASIVKGLAARLAGGRLGLLHFDAHSDLEGPGKGNAHARVISDLAGLAPGSRAVVQPSRVIQIGIRDFSRAERERSSPLRRVITANDVAWAGTATVVETAYRTLAKEADWIYVTFDLDAISPAEFPAVHTPKPGGGLGVAQAAAALQYLFQSPRVIGGDLVEYNPSKDVASSGAKTVFEIVASACGYQTLLARPCAGW